MTSKDIILWFFLFLFIASALLLGWLIWPFVSIIILASVVTGLFIPVYTFFIEKNKIKPPIASLVTCLFIFIMLFIPIAFFVGILSKEAYDLYNMGKNAAIGDQLKSLFESSRILERINLFLSNFNFQLTGEELNNAISELGKIVGFFLYEQARSIASNMLKFLVNFFFMLLVIYFLLIDGKRLVDFIINLSPLPKEQDEKLIRKFKDMAGAILIGNGLGGLIQGFWEEPFLPCSVFNPHFCGGNNGLPCLPADRGDRSGIHSRCDLSCFKRAICRRNIFHYFLLYSFRRHRIPVQTQTGGKTCSDAHPARFSFHHGWVKAIRDSWHYLRSVGGNRISNLNRYLSYQLSGETCSR